VHWSRSEDKFVAIVTHLLWVDGSRWYNIFAANSTSINHNFTTSFSTQVKTVKTKNKTRWAAADLGTHCNIGSKRPSRQQTQLGPRHVCYATTPPSAASWQLHHEPKKQDTNILPITSPNVNRFSKLNACYNTLPFIINHNTYFRLLPVFRHSYFTR